MNDALPPNRYELTWKSFIRLMPALPLIAGFHVAPRRAVVELARAADLVLRIGDHLLPLRDPARGAREREDAGEHGNRNTERALHDAGIEVDVRIELSAHEIIVFQRDLLQGERQLEEPVVVQAELAQHLVAGLAHQLRARVVVLVDAVPEAHEAHARVLVLYLGDELPDLRCVADLREDLHAWLVRA